MTASEWAKAFDDLSWRFKGLEADRDDLAQCLIAMRLQWAKAKRERDEARREVCLWQGLDTDKTSEQVAEVRGWDCFKQEDNK